MSGALLWPNRTQWLLLFAASIVLATYLLRHLIFLTAVAQRRPAPAIATQLPAVTVLVPCHNEIRVAEGLICALSSLEYPAHLLDVILIDDRSTDGTGDFLQAAVGDRERWMVLRRSAGARAGKSAALNDALAYATGEIVVVFDADHQPTPGCLQALVEPFGDPLVAAAQGRCVVRNPGDGLIAHMVAIDYFCGYLVDMTGRDRIYGLPAYGGANCAVRRAVLDEVGSWNLDSVTEDTDLSLRVWLAGYRIAYVERAVDTELAVTGLRAFYRQRYRWARGHQKVCRDYRVAVLRSKQLGWSQKFEAILYLFVFHIPALCFLTSLLALARAAVPTPGTQLWPIAALMATGPVLELGGGLIRARRPRREVLILVIFPFVYLVSMLLCTRALLDGWLRTRYVWVKTERTASEPNAMVGAA